MDARKPRVPSAAFDVRAAWRGPQLDAEDWIWPASDGLIGELEESARAARALGKQPADLVAADFAGPVLARESDRWLSELDSGRGFLLLRGLPVERWGDELSSLAYLGIGLSMGALSSQNAAGDLLGHIRDTGADPDDPSVRLYKTRVAQPFHTDGADIIGLLCLRPAKQGGVSRIVSSISVVAEIHRKHPDLAPRLFEPFHFDRNNEEGPGEPRSFQLPISHWDGERLRNFYVGWYIRDAQRHPEVPRLTEDEKRLLDIVDETAADPALTLDMDFQPGDVQLLKNSSILHSRGEYEDWPQAERRRHLLRFWVAARSGFGGSDERLRPGIAKKAGVESDAEAL